MSRRVTPEEADLWAALTRRFAPIRTSRRLTAEDELLWRSVTGGPHPPTVKPTVTSPKPAVAASPPMKAPMAPALARKAAPPPPGAIEPGRKRRIVRERDPIDARLDLHGMDQDRARAVLDGFIHWAHGQHHRAVLVITGKGVLGDGVLRQRTPEWLASPTLRPLVAGVSHADRRHGGDGALYVALKRKS